MSARTRACFKCKRRPCFILIDVRGVLVAAVVRFPQVGDHRSSSCGHRYSAHWVLSVLDPDASETLVVAVAACNRTYYGEVGRTYELEVHRPREDRMPFVCHLTFQAPGGDMGDLVQVGPTCSHQGLEVLLHAFVTITLHASECSASRSGRFTSAGGAPVDGLLCVDIATRLWGKH
jgi:hypothetical protein